VRHSTAGGEGRRALTRSALALSMSACLLLVGPSPILQLPDAGPVTASAERPTTPAATTRAAAPSAPSVHPRPAAGAEGFPAFTTYPMLAPPSGGTSAYPVAPADTPSSDVSTSAPSEGPQVPVDGASHRQDPPQGHPEGREGPGVPERPSAPFEVPAEPEQPPASPEVPAQPETPADTQPEPQATAPPNPDPLPVPVSSPPTSAVPTESTTVEPGEDELRPSPEGLLLQAEVLAEAWALREPAPAEPVTDAAGWDGAVALGWWWGLVESCVLAEPLEQDRCLLVADELMRGLDVPAPDPARWAEAEPAPRELGYRTVLRVLGRAAADPTEGAPGVPPELPSWVVRERWAVEP
jgi:hypothetical protein